MKELCLEEVLRIAGGVPAAAALDEVTYGAVPLASPGLGLLARKELTPATGFIEGEQS